MNELKHLVRDVLLNRIAASILVPSRVRWAVLRLFGLAIERSYISPGCFIGGKGLKIGEDVFINYECFFDTSAQVTIERNVRVGMRCLFLTGTHETGGTTMRAGTAVARSVVVEEGCWIGANVTILPGVVVGKGSVVGAGTIVTKDVQQNCVVAGSPARVIRRLPSP